MNSNERGTPNRAAEPLPLTRAAMVQAVWDQGRRLWTRLLWGAALLAALVAAGLLAGGCGGQSGDRSASAPQSNQAVAASQTGALVLDTRAASTPAHETRGVALSSVTEDSLPPDVAVSVYQGTVQPGSTVDLSAEGSPDVVTVTLGDGSGGKHPFAYDADAGLWRVMYRVPVRPREDRIALSVTARNASGRWHRVWTFLTVEAKPVENAPAGPDTTSKQ